MVRGGFAGFLEDVAAVVPELARRHVEREEDILAGGVAGLRDRFEHDVERFAVGFQARREAAFVADAGRQAALLQRRAQRVKDLGAGAKRFGERRSADRHHHEFLHVDVRVGVRAAVQDVHHRHRQHVAAAACGEVHVERLLRRRPPPHARPPSRRPAARSRRAGSWSACRRARSFSCRASAGRHRRRRRPWRFRRSRSPPLSARLCRRNASCRRRAARALRARRSRRLTAPPRVRPRRPRADLHFDGRVAARIQNFPAVHA